MTQVDLKTHLRSLERKLLVVSLIGLVILIMLSIVSNYVLKVQAATTATSMIRREVARDIRDAVYTLSEAELNYFSGVIYYDADGVPLFSVPSTLDRYKKLIPVEQLFTGTIETVIYFDPIEKKSRLASVNYFYNRFDQVPWALLIWVCFLLATFPLIRASRKRLIANYNREIQFNVQASREELARRVRHDIRSPLSALAIATNKATSISGERLGIVIMATNRIREIANDLEAIRSTTDTSAPPVDPKSSGDESHSILSFIQDVVHEKRVQQTGPTAVKVSARFGDDAFFLFSSVDPAEFKRALSNIIENAVEASVPGGTVQIGAVANGGMIEVSVTDEGKGIPADVLPRLGERGFSFDKPSGTGLGLHYAMALAQGCGGDITISPNEPKGTSIRIVLPSATPPAWYTGEIEVPSDVTIAIVDDQAVSRQALRSRFTELSLERVKIEEFATADSFSQWQSQRSQTDKAKSLYFFDYDLGLDQPTGLDAIESLPAGQRTYLVTGHFDHPGIQGRCLKHAVKLIPKFQVGVVAITAVELNRSS